MVASRQVLKFGGAALRDGPAVEHCVDIVASRSGARPLVVVSAHAGVTALLERAVGDAAAGEVRWDELRVRHRTLLRQLGLEGELVDRHLRELRGLLTELARAREVDPRLRDAALSFGERISVRIVAEVLRRRGLEATPLDAFDVGLVAGPGTAAGGAGTIVPHPPAPRVRETLARVPGIPVVTGFVAADARGALLTLGPNGSDLSAVWFGEALRASEVELWKDVPGFLTADPRVVPAARRLPVIGRDEAVALAVHGADVLHPGALEPARRADVPVRIKSFAEPEAPGTVIVAHTPDAGPLGLAQRRRLVHWREAVRTTGDADALPDLVNALAAAGSEPYRVAATGTEVAVLVPETPALLALAERRGARLERGLATVAVVGRGVGEDRALHERLRDAARALGVAVADAPGGPSPSSRVLLAADADAERLAATLHAELFE